MMQESLLKLAIPMVSPRWYYPDRVYRYDLSLRACKQALISAPCTIFFKESNMDSAILSKLQFIAIPLLPQSVFLGTIEVEGV